MSTGRRHVLWGSDKLRGTVKGVDLGLWAQCTINLKGSDPVAPPSPRDVKAV